MNPGPYQTVEVVPQCFTCGKYAPLGELYERVDHMSIEEDLADPTAPLKKFNYYTSWYCQEHK